MHVLRTPDERFDGLTGYPFAPRYAEVADQSGGSLRVHFLDEGDASGEVVLLLHGEPSWSYLYRTVVPPLVAAGHRVIVPDLVGFGRSDKPVERSDYSYARHVEWMRELLLDHLDLAEITMFCQDWGGLIGLRLLGEHPGRFARVVAANTGLPTGDQKVPDALRQWQELSQAIPEFPVGRLIDGGCVSDLPPEVIAAYDAPFPDETYKAGARVFPTLIPTDPDDPEAPAQRAAWETISAWDKPFLLAFSDRDPITGGGDKPFRELVAGAQGQPHITIEGAGHFLQEDQGPKVAEVILDLMTRTPRPTP